MPKLLVSILITLSLICSLNAEEKKESKEWNEIKSATKTIIDKGSTFSNHVMRDAKDSFEEINKNEEVKKLKKDFSNYYEKISRDTKSFIDKISNSDEAKNIRKKSDELWKSIFGEKPKK